MPSLSQVSDVDWARMMCSTSVGCYAIMDALRNVQPLPRSADDNPKWVENLLKAEWIEPAGNSYRLTEAALAHLGSF